MGEALASVSCKRRFVYPLIVTCDVTTNNPTKNDLGAVWITLCCLK